MNPSKYAIDIILHNGNSVRIRAIKQDDKLRLLEAFHRLTEQSIYSRFLGSKHKLSDKELN